MNREVEDMRDINLSSFSLSLCLTSVEEQSVRGEQS